MLRLTTLRSHDQYNTTVYGLDDRYLGVFGGRMVVFMNEAEMQQRGIAPASLVEIESIAEDGKPAYCVWLQSEGPRHSSRLDRRLLPGNQPVAAAGTSRAQERHAGSEIDTGAGSTRRQGDRVAAKMSGDAT
jgi:Molydopterin dinucleotide binding domain